MAVSRSSPTPPASAGAGGGDSASASVEVVARALLRVQLERRDHSPEQRLVHGRALDEEYVQALVALLGEEQTARRGAVAARAAGLLVVGLHRPGHAGVGHRPHIGL